MTSRCHQNRHVRCTCFQVKASAREFAMRSSFIHPLVCAALLALSQAGVANDAAVTIISPTDGARLEAGTPNTISYDVIPGNRGDHTHLYVDEKQEGILRSLKGSYKLPPLSPGLHEICIRVVNKGHTPTGTEKCIQVNAQ